MNDEAAFTRAMQENPADTSLRLIFADWLEEQGDLRGELIRSLHMLTQSVKVRGRKKLEDRLRSLVAAGVKPVGPFWTNSIGMKLAWVPAGTFLMGSPTSEEGRGHDEGRHQVTLTEGLWVAVHPVTQACWRAVMGNKPSYHQGDDLPVDAVSWDDCQQFLGQLSEQDGNTYRLPTEAEWEFACRAGTTTPFYFGKTISTEEANYSGNFPYGKAEKGLCRGKTTPVGTCPANAFGLHDMHGNVDEWCFDRHADYPQENANNPQGPQEGERRVVRGGSFNYRARHVRSATRNMYRPTSRSHFVGFRVARAFPP
jgi:uncharacterized protein (TIGR02996 family)